MTQPFDMTETCLSTQLLHEGKVLQLRLDTVQLPDGKTGYREVANHPGGVVVLPVLANGHLVLVQQFRYAVGHTLLEFPAGKLDWVHGVMEDPLKAGQRELREETGYIAEHWVSLGSIYTAPGFTNERLYLYKATGLIQSDKWTQEDEFVETLTLSPADILEKIKTATLLDAKTICLMAWGFMPELRTND